MLKVFYLGVLVEFWDRCRCRCFLWWRTRVRRTGSLRWRDPFCFRRLVIGCCLHCRLGRVKLHAVFSTRIATICTALATVGRRRGRGRGWWRWSVCILLWFLLPPLRLRLGVWARLLRFFGHAYQINCYCILDTFYALMLVNELENRTSLRQKFFH